MYPQDIWLSLGKCLERTLNAMGFFRIIFFDVQDDLEDTEDEKSNRENRLVKVLKNHITKLYSMFVQSINSNF